MSIRLELNDDYIPYLLHWIYSLKNLREKVRERQMDNELEEELSSIIDRLTWEVGFRIVDSD